MATVALTRIKFGKEDGSEFVVEEGEDVKASDFPKDVWDWLKENGTVGTPPRPREEDASAAELEQANEELSARVAELEAQLADAKKTTGGAPKAPNKPPTP